MRDLHAGGFLRDFQVNIATVLSVRPGITCGPIEDQAGWWVGPIAGLSMSAITVRRAFGAPFAARIMSQLLSMPERNHGFTAIAAARTERWPGRSDRDGQSTGDEWSWWRTKTWMRAKDGMEFAPVVGPQATPKGLRQTFTVMAL